MSSEQEEVSAVVDAEVAAAAPPAETAAAETAESRGGGLDFVLDVPLRVTVEIGSAELLVRDVLQLSKGSVVELNRSTGEPADVFVNDRLVARGEVTVVDERMAIRVVEVVGTDGAGRGER